MTISDVLLKMDAQRNRLEAYASARKEEFLKDNKELSNLLSKKNELLLTMLKNRLNNTCDESVNEKIKSINDKITEKYGDWEAAFYPEYKCKKCRDTGFESVSGRKRMCVCLKNLAPVMLYGAKDVDSLKGSFDSFDESVFKDENQKKMMKAAKQIAFNMTDKTARPYFVLSGTSGLGKSFLLECMAKRIKNSGRTVIYMDAFDLFTVFHKKRLGEDISTELIFEADALFIDDMGTEPMTANVTREYLFELLTERETSGKLTAIACNLTLSQIKERYTEKTASRLFSQANGSVLRLEGKDIRL